MSYWSGIVIKYKLEDMLALLYNVLVYIQIFTLKGGTSQRRVSRYKSEYLYIHEYLYNKILVS